MVGVECDSEEPVSVTRTTHFQDCKDQRWKVIEDRITSGVDNIKVYKLRHTRVGECELKCQVGIRVEGSVWEAALELCILATPATEWRHRLTGDQAPAGRLGWDVHV